MGRACEERSRSTPTCSFAATVPRYLRNNHVYCPLAGGVLDLSANILQHFLIPSLANTCGKRQLLLLLTADAAVLRFDP